MLIRALPFSRLLAAAALAALLAGCPSLTRPPVASAEHAQVLSQRGDHAGAARLWEELAADNPGVPRADFLLRAAAEWLEAATPDYAARALDSIDTTLSPAQALERSYLRVDLALARGQGTAAWTALAALPLPAGPPQAPRYLELRERAAFATGRPTEGVRAEIDRERWLANATGRADSRATLLRELREASERGMNPDPQAVHDPVERGWLELGPIALAMARSPASAGAQLEAWRARNPVHPALEVVRTQLLGPGAAPAVESAPHLALLLPVTGPLAGAALQVRDGFMAAAERVPEAARPPIHVYDTAAMSVADAIAQASAAGAEFIVGPLTREELLVATDYLAHRPPMLALNFLPAERAVPENFYQFALSPEDEARQVAQLLIARGQRRGIAFAPAGAWGDRVLAAFSDELLAGGGQLIARASLESGRADFSAQITEALRLTESRARLRRIEGVLGTQLAFEPRRRADVEFIFAPTQPAMARLLRPQLRFHYAGDIPTYATSDAFDPNPTANQDLDGLTFPDMPWMLGTGALTQSLREASAAGTARRGRLFAFGFDAFSLATALRSGSAPRIEGLTGVLTLAGDRRVKRELTWARIHDGQAQLLDQTAPAAATTAAPASASATGAGAAR